MIRCRCIRRRSLPAWSADRMADEDIRKVQTPVAWRGTMVALAKHLPMRLGQMRAQGQAMRALTHTKRKH